MWSLEEAHSGGETMDFVLAVERRMDFDQGKMDFHLERDFDLGKMDFDLEMMDFDLGMTGFDSVDVDKGAR